MVFRKLKEFELLEVLEEELQIRHLDLASQRGGGGGGDQLVREAHWAFATWVYPHPQGDGGEGLEGDV